VAPPVHLVGAEALMLRYATALAAFGVPSVTQTEDAAARGLFQIGVAIEAA
jgi:2-keto-3-deoxy-galactonokinase